MGSLGDNLLKLTEFPFSYSLMSLIAFISFGESFLNQPIETLGPFLILMGFVATTLSIIDPVGLLQRVFLIGFPALNISARMQALKVFFRSGYWGGGILMTFENTRREDIKEIAQRIDDMRVFGLRFIAQRTPTNVLICLSRDYQYLFDKMEDARILINSDMIEVLTALQTRLKTEDESELKEAREVLSQEEKLAACAGEIILKIQSLILDAVKTVWIRREIDKITAMSYFVIIVSIFIIAAFLLESFMLGFLTTFQGNEQARLIILVFSLIALFAVSIMLVIRLRQLRSKALTTFLFLIELDAIKVENERFNLSLKSIEQYLSNGDWTMAGYWVKRVMVEYDEVIKAKFAKILQGGKISEDTWGKKIGTEDIKNTENRKINYQDLGIY